MQKTAAWELGVEAEVTGLIFAEACKHWLFQLVWKRGAPRMLHSTQRVVGSRERSDDACWLVVRCDGRCRSRALAGAAAYDSPRSTRKRKTVRGVT